MIVFGREYLQKKLGKIPAHIRKQMDSHARHQAAINKKQIESERQQMRDLYEEIKRLKNED